MRNRVPWDPSISMSVLVFRLGVPESSSGRTTFVGMSFAFLVHVHACQQVTGGITGTIALIVRGLNGI
jgi:hypothetical protein